MRRFNLYNNTERNVFLIFFYQFIYYFKILLIRLNYLIVILLCVYVLANDVKTNGFSNYIKPKVLFIAKPQMFIVRVIDSILVFLKDNKVLFSSLREENILLKEENLRNRQKLLQYEKVLYENGVLRELLNFLRNNKDIHRYKIVKLFIMDNNIFSKRIQINFGKKYGINDNDFVVDKLGNLIGKVINSTDDTSEVLLLTDMYARFISVAGKSRFHFISAGYGSNDLIDVTYAKEQNFSLSEGEMVYAIFSDEINFPIGRVIKVKDKFKIKPNVKLNQLDYAIVVVR